MHVLPSGRRIVYRAGMIYGGASFVGYDPSTRTLVVILRNVTSWPDQRGFDVMERFFQILGLHFGAKSEKLYGVFSKRKEVRP